MIVCNITGDTYYGSTAQTLDERMKLHRRACNNCASRDIILRGDYTPIWLEDWPCNSKFELERRERWWILNNVCVNKVVPAWTKEEWREKNKVTSKKYYETHKEEHAIKAKEYAVKNADRLKVYGKQYRQKNAKHRSEQQKEYREKNKDKIRAQKRAHQQANKEHYAAYLKMYHAWNRSWDGLNKMDVF